MSELKRNVDLHARPVAKPLASGSNSLEDSQPRQTLEQERLKRLWESGCDMGGGDPYNTIGMRAFRPHAA